MTAVRALLLCLGLLLVSGTQGQQKKMDIPQSVTLSNSKGFKVVLTPIGATIQNIFVPNCKTGKLIDVTLGWVLQLPDSTQTARRACTESMQHCFSVLLEQH